MPTLLSSITLQCVCLFRTTAVSTQPALIHVYPPLCDCLLAYHPSNSLFPFESVESGDVEGAFVVLIVLVIPSVMHPPPVTQLHNSLCLLISILIRFPPPFLNAFECCRPFHAFALFTWYIHLLLGTILSLHGTSTRHSVALPFSTLSSPPLTHQFPSSAYTHSFNPHRSFSHPFFDLPAFSFSSTLILHLHLL